MGESRVEKFRGCVPAAKTQVYFDTAGTGLIPDFVHDAVAKYQEERYLKGGDSTWQYDDEPSIDTLSMIARAKGSIAKMIGANEDEIAFGQNSSQMYTIFSSGLVFSPGDNIILPKDGWMANRFAWQIRTIDGLEIRYVKPKDGKLLAEDCIALCDERTKAICMPLVEPSTGYLLDAKSIGNFCREKGIWFAVDGVQALGIIPVDVEEMCIDFLVGNDYKWMMNYCGTGYAYIRNALQAELKQLAAGWMSDDDRFNTKKEILSLRSDAGRFELGYPTISGVHGIGLVAEKYDELGRDAIWSYVGGLMDYLDKKISETAVASLLYDFPKSNRSAIAVLLIEKAAEVSQQSLTENGICAQLKPFDDEGRQTMRVSLHYYNHKEDIDRLMEVIGKKGRSNE